MGRIANKLAYTLRARKEIRQAIASKGVDCPGSAPFCVFDDYIKRIETGGGPTDIKCYGTPVLAMERLSIVSEEDIIIGTRENCLKMERLSIIPEETIVIFATPIYDAQIILLLPEEEE